MRKIHLPSPSLSFSEPKRIRFRYYIVKESMRTHREVLTQYYSYRAHLKEKVFFCVLNLLHYLPEHHLHHEKVMLLTMGYLPLTLQAQLFSLTDRHNLIQFQKLGDISSDDIKCLGSAEVGSMVCTSREAHEMEIIYFNLPLSLIQDSNLLRGDRSLTQEYEH